MRVSLIVPVLASILIIGTTGFTLQSADAAPISCPTISNFINGEEAWLERGEDNGFFLWKCTYDYRYDLQLTPFIYVGWHTEDDGGDSDYYCSGEENYDYGRRQFYSKNIVAYAAYYGGKNIIQPARQLLDDLESKNIAVLCTGDTKQDTQTGCPAGFPYLHSDGQCWDVPECTKPDFPYPHSDGLCWDVPECTKPDFPYPHSDGLCWDVPECTNPDFPYPRSDGKCGSRVECTNPDFPYPRSDGKCGSRVECTNPDFPYSHSDGSCYDVVECTNPDFPYSHSDGQCRAVQECDADFPYLHSDGSCYNIPEELTDDTTTGDLGIPTPPGWTNVVPVDSFNKNANCGVVYSGGVDSYSCKTKSDGHAKFYYANGSYLVGPTSEIAVYPPAPFIGMPGDSVQRLDISEGTLELEFNSSNEINCSQCKPIDGVGITFGQYSVGLEGTKIFLDVKWTSNGVLTVLEGSAEIWKTSDPDNKVLVSSGQQIDAITNEPLGQPTQASSEFLSSIQSIDQVPKNPGGGDTSLEYYALEGIALFIIFGIPAIIIGLVIRKIKQRRRRKKQIKIQS